MNKEKGGRRRFTEIHRDSRVLKRGMPKDGVSHIGTDIGACMELCIIRKSEAGHDFPEQAN